MNGWSSLINELDMEIKRISTRNLGRDDRVISDHGRESRLPFLDEHVVGFLAALPIDIKVSHMFYSYLTLQLIYSTATTGGWWWTFDDF